MVFHELLPYGFVASHPDGYQLYHEENGSRYRDPFSGEFYDTVEELEAAAAGNGGGSAQTNDADVEPVDLGSVSGDDDDAGETGATPTVEEIYAAALTDDAETLVERYAGVRMPQTIANTFEQPPDDWDGSTFSMDGELNLAQWQDLVIVARNAADFEAFNEGLTQTIGWDIDVDTPDVEVVDLENVFGDDDDADDGEPPSGYIGASPAADAIYTAAQTMSPAALSLALSGASGIGSIDPVVLSHYDADGDGALSPGECEALVADARGVESSAEWQEFLAEAQPIQEGTELLFPVFEVDIGGDGDGIGTNGQAAENGDGGPEAALEEEPAEPAPTPTSPTAVPGSGLDVYQRAVAGDVASLMSEFGDGRNLPPLLLSAYDHDGNGSLSASEWGVLHGEANQADGITQFRDRIEALVEEQGAAAAEEASEEDDLEGERAESGDEPLAEAGDDDDGDGRGSGRRRRGRDEDERSGAEEVVAAIAANDPRQAEPREVVFDDDDDPGSLPMKEVLQIEEEADFVQPTTDAIEE